jgi:uncharacterized protein YktA (UPF0223 family)
VTKESVGAAFGILAHYEKCYEKKYGKKPLLNKYKEKWGAISLLDDFGKEKVIIGIEYYFKLNKDGHPLGWLFNNFDIVYNSYESNIKDEKLRAERRAQTAKLKQEYLNGNA